MAQFTSGVVNPTITTGATNLNIWAVTSATAGNIASVKMFSWGGDDTSLIAYLALWGRVTNTPATPTAFATETSSPGITPNFNCSTYATAATGTSGKFLYRQAFNSQGGGGAIVLPIGGEWRISGGALGTTYSMIGCGCAVASGTNSAWNVQWEE